MNFLCKNGEQRGEKSFSVPWLLREGPEREQPGLAGLVCPLATHT